MTSHVRLRGVASAENRFGVVAEVADLILVAAAEAHAVAIIDQREDAAAHRAPRLPGGKTRNSDAQARLRRDNHGIAEPPK
jgi:hypothetical protein